jgi:hypothetical protein
MMQFWDLYESSWVLTNLGVSGYNIPSGGEVWDYDAASSFCVDNGVDIMFVPPYNYLEQLYSDADIQQAKTFLQNRRVSEQFDIIEDATTRNMFFADMVGYLAFVNKSLIPSNMSMVRCDNDIISYLKGYYGNKYLGQTPYYISPTLRPDGLPHSTTLNDGTVTQEHYDFIIAAKALIDVNPLDQTLPSQINALDPTGNFRCNMFIYNRSRYKWFTNLYTLISFCIYNDRGEHTYTYSVLTF